MLLVYTAVKSDLHLNQEPVVLKLTRNTYLRSRGYIQHYRASRSTQLSMHIVICIFAGQQLITIQRKGTYSQARHSIVHWMTL